MVCFIDLIGCWIVVSGGLVQFISVELLNLMMFMLFGIDSLVCWVVCIVLSVIGLFVYMIVVVLVVNSCEVFVWLDLREYMLCMMSLFVSGVLSDLSRCCVDLSLWWDGM